MKIVGVDPGKSGGLACIDSLNGTFKYIPMPLVGKEIDAKAIHVFLMECQPDLVVIEKVHAMPGQGVTSMFNFGKAYGSVIGLVTGLSIPLAYVTPQAWKKLVLAGTNKDKDAAITYVAQRYPNINLVLPRCRKPHDGIADAVCIAEYGIKTNVTSTTT